MNELDNLCDFVLKSSNFYDFGIRFNFLLNMAVSSFENKLKEKKTLPIFTHKIIDELNNKVNELIDKINERENVLGDGIISQNIFLLIIQENFPQHYENYQYQNFLINN